MNQYYGKSNILPAWLPVIIGTKLRVQFLHVGNVNVIAVFVQDFLSLILFVLRQLPLSSAEVRLRRTESTKRIEIEIHV